MSPAMPKAVTDDHLDGVLGRLMARRGNDVLRPQIRPPRRTARLDTPHAYGWSIRPTRAHAHRVSQPRQQLVWFDAAAIVDGV